jgi:hypothetical protein
MASSALLLPVVAHPWRQRSTRISGLAAPGLVSRRIRPDHLLEIRQDCSGDEARARLIDMAIAARYLAMCESAQGLGVPKAAMFNAASRSPLCAKERQRASFQGWLEEALEAPRTSKTTSCSSSNVKGPRLRRGAGLCVQGLLRANPGGRHAVCSTMERFRQAWIEMVEGARLTESRRGQQTLRWNRSDFGREGLLS